MKNKTENRIIQLSEKKFIQLGIRNVSIDDVCNELHISKKTFYKYFPQKENLIEAVIENRDKLNLEKFNKRHQNINTVDMLVLIIKELRKNESNRPHIFMHDLQKYYPEIYSKFKTKQQIQIKEGFENYIKRGIDEGYYRKDLDIEMVSYYHSVQIQSIAEQMQQAMPKVSNKRMMDFFIDLIIRLITNEKGFEYIQNSLNKDTT
ncbi:MAG: TetR/AcrR family transcriptional regulator [Paludibacteraceae bacterium]